MWIRFGPAYKILLGSSKANSPKVSGIKDGGVPVRQARIARDSIFRFMSALIRSPVIFRSRFDAT
jgi:hypothetical protein